MTRPGDKGGRTTRRPASRLATAYLAKDTAEAAAKAEVALRRAIDAFRVGGHQAYPIVVDAYSKSVVAAAMAKKAFSAAARLAHTRGPQGVKPPRDPEPLDK